jgi:ATP-dependent DNA helicase RecG
MVSLDTSLRTVVGKAAPILADKLDLHTVGDLLRHYPRRWDKRGELTNFGDLVAGEYATLFARIKKVTSRQITTKTNKRMNKTDVIVTDGSQDLVLTFFNQRGWQLNRFPEGASAYFSGKVELFNRKLQLVNPEVEVLEDEDDISRGDFAGAILPIYPAVKELSTVKIRNCMMRALDVIDLPEDPVPQGIRDRLGLLGYKDALERIGVRSMTACERRSMRGCLSN